MPPSEATHLFAFGLTTPPATSSLENLVLRHLEQAAHHVQAAMGGASSACPPSAEACAASPQDAAALVNEMGDYIARTAMIWSSLIRSLIQGPHIDHVTLQILEKSRADTRVADLSASVAMDVTLGRLRKMRDLAAQYSHDVQAVWKAGGHRRMGSSYSATRRMSFSSHDGSPSAASSEPQPAPPASSDEASLAHAPRHRRQLPDAAAAPREGVAAGGRAAPAPHPPLPPLPLLPPASSLLLPPILPSLSETAAPEGAPPPPTRPARKKPMTKAALKRAAAQKPLLISTPMVAMPMAAAPEPAATPPSVETTPTSAATPVSAATPTMANTSFDQDESDDYSDENQFAGINMKALKQRGKGKYYCPRGYHCDKGGVDKHGNLVLFDRNSSFAQHCNKHRKPWRCDVPGCPNPPKKRRFARRDGLERHKATVKHYFMT
ncbi:hypothetical protein Trco_004953 [Trichoderma cornu-damae]|uniref:Uncharacterized protein n=1 Tax=Trichoderma cornu-damae TaxID=654480 RepID=A0A9P8QI56_9HYPO|nr:hypothetical protein Trco_004953 [Trichoderma cornu-damae]